MKTKRYCLILFMLGIGFNLSLAQEPLQIFGSVDSAGHRPLVGARLLFKAGKSTTGTTSQGHFILLLRRDVDTLIVSDVGYKTATVVVTPKTKYPLQVSLVPELAQEPLQIFGSVDSAGHRPLVGARLLFKAGKSTTGTTSQGHFILLLRRDVDTLIVSDVGYKTATVIVTPKTKYPLKVSLVPATSQDSPIKPINR